MALSLSVQFRRISRGLLVSDTARLTPENSFRRGEEERKVHLMEAILKLKLELKEKCKKIKDSFISVAAKGGSKINMMEAMLKQKREMENNVEEIEKQQNWQLDKVPAWLENLPTTGQSDKPRDGGDEENDAPFDIDFALDIVYKKCHIKPSHLDKEEHFDYTDEDVDELSQSDHKEPMGFIRIGLKAPKKWKVSKSWKVSYHGTIIESIKGIVETGYKMSANPKKRFKAKKCLNGPGMYSSPDPDFASDGWYAEHFQYRGRR